MCKECDWRNDTGQNQHRFRQQCDCGHADWQQVDLQHIPENRLSLVYWEIYRCVRCDNLRQVSKLANRKVY